MKYGIKFGFPVLRRISVKLSAYAQLVRPFTLLAPVIAGLFGTILPLIDAGLGFFDAIWLHWQTIIYVAVTLALSQACGQIINQACDVDIDRINKPYRPIPQGLVSIDEAKTIGFLFAFFALARSLTINLVFGLLTAVILFFAIFYSLEPIRMKKRDAWGALFWQAISRGLLPFLATWSVFGDLSNPKPWLLGITAFFWCFALQSTKDFTDYEGDKQYNIPTLVTIYGVKKSLKIMVILVVFAILAIVNIGIQTEKMAITTPMILMAVIAIISLHKQYKIEELENNLAWVCYYLGLGLWYILSVFLV